MKARKGRAESGGALKSPLGGHFPAREPAHERALRTLSPAECLGLLEAGGVGRIGFAAANGIMMLPVNFALMGKAIIFRTAPDTLLAVYANGQVSFEADHLDEAAREGWSVLVQGRAHIVTDERDVKRLEDRTKLEPWAGGARDVYVRIAPIRISGRCIETLPGTACSW
jgi:nitroimidazol reductase NimA-like FMN-containing flavoprotein (pyridoxamine 5'-phosphate oxidase superfamily)